MIPLDCFTVRSQDEYKTAVSSGVWHKPIQFATGETVVMHNVNVMVHYGPSSVPDEWGNVQVCFFPLVTLSSLLYIKNNF